MGDDVTQPEPGQTEEVAQPEESVLQKYPELIISAVLSVIVPGIIGLVTHNALMSLWLAMLILFVGMGFGNEITDRVVAAVPHKHRTYMRRRRRQIFGTLIALWCGLGTIGMIATHGTVAPHSAAAVPTTVPARCEPHTFCFLIATLQGPENDEYVTARLREKLEAQFDLAHVDVVPTVVAGRRAVRAAAVQAGADVAIWGVYTDKDGAGGDVYFEVVDSVRDVKKMPFDQPIAQAPIPPGTFNVHIEHTIDAIAYLAHATYGIYLSETGAYTDAVAELTTALSHATPAEIERSGTVYFFRGQSRYAEGQASAAADDMQLAIDHQPDAPVTYSVDRGLALYDARRYNESFDQFRRVIARYVPATPLDIACPALKATGVPEPAYYGLAANYTYRHQLPEARKALTSALCLDPSDAWATHALDVLSKVTPTSWALAHI